MALSTPLSAHKKTVSLFVLVDLVEEAMHGCMDVEDALDFLPSVDHRPGVLTFFPFILYASSSSIVSCIRLDSYTPSTPLGALAGGKIYLISLFYIHVRLCFHHQKMI